MNINKYKINYQKGGSQLTPSKIFLLDGTSSSGKSTICKNFEKFGISCLIGDDYFSGKYFRDSEKKYEDFIKDLSNEYFGKATETFRNIVANRMIDDALKLEKSIIDYVIPEPFIKVINSRGLNDSFKIILLYTGIPDLVRNIESRRKKGDPRGKFVFKQFAKRYIRTDDSGIDVINRVEFRKLLISNLKYEFKNKEELFDFSNEVFEMLNINDDLDHNITVKDDYKYDYLVSTLGKSKDEIFEEIEKILA
tara:strand:+ start:35 stop:787 length:753 start_codon:yes stop_codon:yes gene_type:complete